MVSGSSPDAAGSVLENCQAWRMPTGNLSDSISGYYEVEVTLQGRACTFQAPSLKVHKWYVNVSSHISLPQEVKESKAGGWSLKGLEKFMTQFKTTCNLSKQRKWNHKLQGRSRLSVRVNEEPVVLSRLPQQQNLPPNPTNLATKQSLPDVTID